jgi:hypothetical protein
MAYRGLADSRSETNNMFEVSYKTGFASGWNGEPKEREEAGRDDDGTADELSALGKRLQEQGILPLKIRLPKAGTVHRFSRLMTTQDALALDATFVHVRLPWVPFAAMGLVLLPFGGFSLLRLIKL